MIYISKLRLGKTLLKQFSGTKYSEFKWSEYNFPSSLQLSEYLETLLTPLQEHKAFKKLELGLHEALINAVKHGNLEDSRKYLRVRRIVTPNWFVWQIQDDGQGIPPEKRILSLPKKIDAQSGRGLFIICQCFDDIRWSNKGNRLQVACRR